MLQASLGGDWKVRTTAETDSSVWTGCCFLDTRTAGTCSSLLSVLLSGHWNNRNHLLPEPVGAQDCNWISRIFLPALAQEPCSSATLSSSSFTPTCGLPCYPVNPMLQQGHLNLLLDPATTPCRTLPALFLWMTLLFCF